MARAPGRERNAYATRDVWEAFRKIDIIRRSSCGAGDVNALLAGLRATR